VTAYYNDHDRYCCDWLSNLMDAGEITPGRIDDRDIRELTPFDVAGYERAHFFAGIGGWDVALNLAGWGSRPVWTGSCPCQPFSAAGKRAGGADARHVWPHWFRLIRECRPAVVFGEQVEKAIGWGWLDAVLADLEAESYATGAAVLPACGVGAPHIRQRVWWVADALGSRLEVNGQQPAWDQRAPAQRGGAAWHPCDWLACTDGKARPIEPGTFPMAAGVRNRVGRLRAFGNAIVPQVAASFIGAVM
jgi:DNA (cytosine-5)-methyltransferase 1